MNISTEHSYDSIVIGAGAGGLAAAARLVAAGKKVLLLEAKDRVGGRASSEDIDGFRVNIGAIAIEIGSTFEETMKLVDAPLDVREPTPATVFRIDGKIINPAKGGWGLLLGGITKSAAKIGAKFADARKGDLPEENISTQQWLEGYTKNKTVHALFRNLCAAIFAVNADELPARAFLIYFATKGAFKQFGFCPRGTIGVWQDLAAGIEHKGGTVVLNTPVKRIESADGKVTGVTVSLDGKDTFIAAKTVVSNMGPTATVALAGEDLFGAEYVEKLKRTVRPTANIVINFATRERLIDIPGLITFGNTRRLCNMGELTYTCPELAPDGWYMYVAYAVPRPAMGDFDEASEIELAMQDLRDEFPAFVDAKMLSVRVMKGDWPAQRSCSGYDMPQETPIANLWNVGDAVKDYGDGGTQACAVSAKNVSAHVVEYLA
ncbi:phytoene desaturase family protein [Zhongshania aliphaticivorans]|uniref:phytoene desaturase family protein n=1 Tax=Zhongshania aliphaticivorans TaxID=1470434 RepID=UPI0012E42DE7|nr:FAD-dependent oxidoreductase [Zhongshania aliphaticivorans]CAA0101410.1 Phytoene desaturase (lycopene-forming) [Zhongshania aliphaticivorans]